MLGCWTSSGVSPAVAIEGEIGGVVQGGRAGDRGEMWDGNKVFCVAFDEFGSAIAFRNDVVGFVVGGAGSGAGVVGCEATVVRGGTRAGGRRCGWSTGAGGYGRLAEEMGCCAGDVDFLRFGCVWWCGSGG